VAAVDAHVTGRFGAPVTVFHEAVSPYVHVDVHVVEPFPDRPVVTLVTSGMSEAPMRSSTGDRFAELMMVLPPTWPRIGSPAFEQAGAAWPYTLLQDLARLPHAFETLLWSGHTVPNGEPPEPYASDTKLCGALIAPPVIPDDELETLTVGNREITFFAVWPLHADEMRLKLDKGVAALYDLLDEAEVTEIVDADRPSVVPKRRRLFGR
jgi:hypothetical protein